MNLGIRKSFLHYFPAPRFLKMPAVGLEITPEAVRFLELVETSKGKRVGRYGERILPQSEGQTDDFLLGERLKKVVEEVRDSGHLKFVKVTLPEEKVYLFTTDMPSLSSDEMRDGLELKLEENVPVPVKEAVFDFDLLGHTEKQNDHVSVSVAVAPRLVVGRYLDFLKKQGFVPLSFEVAAQAVAKAVIARNDFSSSIIVHFGDRESHLSIVDNGSVRFTSKLQVGGASLTEAVKKHFKTSTAEALQIKEEKGITKDGKNTELFFSMASTLSVLKDEINKLAAYYETHQERSAETKKKVSKVLMCGREAALKGLADYFSTGLSIPVEIANVWVNVFSLEEYIPPILFKDSLEYAAVIGLSL